MSIEQGALINFRPKLVPALQRDIEDGRQLAIEDIGFTDVLYQEPLPGEHPYSRWNENIDISGRFTLDIPIRLPIMSSNMPGVTNFEIATQLGHAGGLAVLPRETPIEELRDLIFRLDDYGQESGLSKDRIWFAGAVGVYPRSGPSAMVRAEKMIEWGIPGLFVETQQANSKLVMLFTEELKNKYPNLPIAMGVFNSVDGVRRAIDVGADAVKVGVGAGDTCLTSTMSGVTKGQVNTVIEITDYMDKRFSIPIIIDGGTSTPGGAAIMMSILKGNGAIMLGSKIAAVEESPSQKETIGTDERTTKKVAIIEGMGCERIDKLRGGDPNKRILEGTVIKRKVSGTLSELLQKYEGGFRTAMYGYHGARNWQELADKAEIGVNSSANVIARFIKDE